MKLGGCQMTFDEYQDRARTFLISDNPNYPVMGLAEEAGEVVGKFAKIIRDQDGEIKPENKVAICKELGDVLWMVAVIAKGLDLPLSYVADCNINKLQSRLDRGVMHGSGDDR